MREADPAQSTAAHRTGSYALAGGLHQPGSKQKIIGDTDGSQFLSNWICGAATRQDRPTGSGSCAARLESPKAGRLIGSTANSVH
jgi:hypothetical protein